MHVSSVPVLPQKVSTRNHRKVLCLASLSLCLFCCPCQYQLRWSTHEQVKELLWSLKVVTELRPHMGVLENVVGLQGADGWEQSLHDDVSSALQLVLEELRKDHFCASHLIVDLGSFHQVIRKRSACICVLCSRALETHIRGRGRPVSQLTKNKDSLLSEFVQNQPRPCEKVSDFGVSLVNLPWSAPSKFRALTTVYLLSTRSSGMIMSCQGFLGAGERPTSTCMWQSVQTEQFHSKPGAQTI